MHLHHRKCHNKFQITTQGGTIVRFKDRIRGRVPRGYQNVQLLVYSADLQWYLQKDAQVDRHGHFVVDTTFGLPPSVHGFFVIAVAGDGKVVNSPVQEGDIPATSIVSNAVYVLRAA